MENVLVDVALTGEQLIETIETRHPVYGGISEVDGYRLVDGSLVDLNRIYHVLIPNALYEGGNYYEVKKYNPEAFYTGIDWRVPLIDWITSLKTTRSNSLEHYLTVPSG
jgi:hypothetical protein